MKHINETPTLCLHSYNKLLTNSGLAPGSGLLNSRIISQILILLILQRTEIYTLMTASLRCVYYLSLYYSIACDR